MIKLTGEEAAMLHGVLMIITAIIMYWVMMTREDKG